MDSHVTEDAWINGLKEGRMPFTQRELKRQLYGTSHPSLAIETDVMKAAATRLSQDLSTIEHLFSHGFGALVRGIRTW